jgi:hypothetical protein
MFLTPLSRRPSSCQNGTVVLLAKAKRMLYATLKCPPPGEKSREGVIRWWQSLKNPGKGSAWEIGDAGCFRDSDIRRSVFPSRSLSRLPSPMPKLVNPLPQSLPKECAKAANICAFPCLLLFIVPIVMSSKSRALSTAATTASMAFVSLLHKLPFTQSIDHSSGHPSLHPRTRKRLCHLQHRQGGLPFLRARWIRNCDCALGRRM